jgi:hypothetical protein
MTPISELFFGRSISDDVSQREISCKFQALYTVYILWIIQVYTQNPPIRKGDYQNIICDLRSNKVGSCGELELDSFDIKDGQRAPIEVLQITCGNIAA